MFRLNPFAKANKEEILREALGDENYELYHQVNQFKEMKGIQARMPYVIQIK